MLLSFIGHITSTIADESFWEALTNKAYWQVVLAVLVAYTTYYFADRSRRKAQLARAKSEASRYGYELQQAYSNRLQSELKSSYYEIVAKYKSTKDDKLFFLELAKIEALNNPAQSIEVSKLYGKLIEQYGIIEQLARRTDYKNIKRHVDDFINNHGSLAVHPPGGEINSLEKAGEYNKNGHKNIESIIEENIRKKNKNLTDLTKNVGLKVF